MRPRRPSRLQVTLRLRQGAGRRGDGARVHRRKRKPTSAVPTAERLPRCALSLRAALARCCACGLRAWPPAVHVSEVTSLRAKQRFRFAY